MCLFDDELGIEDWAFIGGFIETQIEGEKNRKQEFDEPLSYEDSLKTGDDVFDDKDQSVDDIF